MPVPSMSRRAPRWLAPLVALAVAAPAARAVDLTADYSNDATELSTGIFMSVNSKAASPFAESRLLMRPFRLDGEGAALGSFLLTSPGSLLEVFLLDGTPVPLPATFAPADLPQYVLVSAIGTGDTHLVLRHRKQSTPVLSRTALAVGESDVVKIHVGPFPGLAGRTLGAYPFFEYVKAVNLDQRIDAAIDPTRHPERVGLPYRSYVVAHKTPAQWAADSSLADVSGGFGSHVVAAGDVQSNTVTVWAAGLLGDASEGLGVPYDVVFDFGLDGRLDPGDLIDGFDATEAGIFVLKDTTALGPYATSQFEFDDPGLFATSAFDSGSSRNLRSRGRVVYPDPPPPGKLPLVTFSHGNTDIVNSYQGYTYLQTLLASYGFVTASFDMFPAHVGVGIRWRAWLTNKNTERMIMQTALYPQMGGGVLDGKVDGARIVTSGHSRGGEGVIVQYNQVAFPEISGIRPPGGTLTGFDASSFKGIHAIAEVTFLSEAQGSTPRDVPFLLYFGSSDDDVCGCGTTVVPTYHYGRASGDKAWVYFYGAGHGYFNSLWQCTCTGPNLMLATEVQAAAKGYLLPWVQRVVRDNVPAQDFFTRSPDRFRPIGTQSIPAVRRLVTMWRDELGTGNFTVDDFETQPTATTSSSGQPVAFDVSSLVETGFADPNPVGGWSSPEPDGGFWWETAGVIFDWNGTDFRYDQTIDPAERDLSDDTYVSFVACQQSNHPETIALAGDASISLTLVDADGVSSRINTSAYGSIDVPYVRSAGGWGTAFKTFRVRIADFETNGSGIDLKNVETLRFEVGSANGSARGRIGLDDIEIVKE